MGNTNSRHGEGTSSSFVTGGGGGGVASSSGGPGGRGDRAATRRHGSVGSSSINATPSSSSSRGGVLGRDGSPLAGGGGGGSSSTSAAAPGVPSPSASSSTNPSQAGATSGGNPWDPTPLYPQEARVDNGHLLPLTNIYPNAPQDWLHDKVQTLIVERKLAPFYRGLEDWDESDEFDKELVDTALDSVGSEQSRAWRRDKRIYSTEDRLAEAAMYKRPQECPICFLYYPPLINTSRCCDQPICTECFVQIKRADPTTTNLISEPAACPYCVEPNFGVTYVPPPPAQRTGLGSSSKPTSSSRSAPKLTRSSSSNSSSAVKSDDTGSSITVGEEEREMGPAAAAHARRKSVSHTAAEVVTVDAIQQDWEVKLASIRATAARRAARRVIFRQIGDRLIPVGISSGQRELNPNNHTIDEQGRIILTGPVPIVGQSTGTLTSSQVESGGASSRLLGRTTRRHRGSSGAAGGSDDARLINMGPDLEELMVMEAMRLSMLDEEERRKKAEREAKKNKKKKSGSSADPNAPSTSTSTGVGGRLSLDAIRNSIDSVRDTVLHRDHHSQGSGSGSGRATPAASNNSPAASGPSSAASRSASTSVSTTSSTPTTAANRPQVQFLKMPPMQRNDSSASMSAHNLPPPLIPTKAQPSSSSTEPTDQASSSRPAPNGDSLL